MTLSQWENDTGLWVWPCLNRFQAANISLIGPNLSLLDVSRCSFRKCRFQDNMLQVRAPRYRLRGALLIVGIKGFRCSRALMASEDECSWTSMSQLSPGRFAKHEGCSRRWLAIVTLSIPRDLQKSRAGSSQVGIVACIVQMTGKWSHRERLPSIVWATVEATKSKGQLWVSPAKSNRC